MHAAEAHTCVLDATAPIPAARRLFAHLPRADQRLWADVYLKGLLTTEGKKSLRSMAASVTPSPTAPQSLQQFINDSAWQWRPVRSELTRWLVERTAVRAWTLAPVIVPKRGRLAAGVHRCFVPAAGRTVNCQLAIGAFLSGESGDLSVDWQLYLPPRWTEDERLRHQVRIPDTTGYVTAAGLCLALADRLARITPRMPPVVVRTDGHIDADAVVEGLDARGLDWIVAFPGTPPLLPPPAHRAVSGAAPRHLDHARALPRGHVRPYAAPGPASGHRRHSAVHVLRASGTEPRTAALSAGRRPGRRAPAGPVWLTNLPPARHAQALALIDSAGTARTGEAETELGLHDFAGRSFPGWHRHATLVSVAAAYRGMGCDRRPGPDPSGTGTATGAG